MTNTSKQKATTKCKILILSHISDLLGGAERSMLDTFDYWNEHYDIEPEFILRMPLKSLAGEIQARGWKYHALDYTFWSDGVPATRSEDIFHNAVRNNRAIVEIEKIIQESKPDIVMTNSVVSPWAAFAAYFQKVPHVWFVREYGDLDHGRVFEIGREQTFQDVGNLSDLVVTNSRTLAAHVEQYVDKQKLTTLYTPFKVDEITKRAAESAPMPFKRKDSLKLVITGNLAPSKGQRESIEAVGMLHEQGHNIELCVIGAAGSAEFMNELSLLIRKYGIEDKIHLVGYQKNPMPYIAAADAGIMASRKEAFGRVTFEYLVAGKPVVGSNSGATPEMVKEGINGYLYDRESVESLKHALLHYAKDKSLVLKHGKSSIDIAKKMLQGDFNADALYLRLQTVVKGADKVSRRPINYFRRELEYVEVAGQVISNSGSLSLRRLVKLRLRQKAKALYYRLRTLKARVTGQ